MTSETGAAPKERRGPYFEDFEVGDVFRSRLGRTITETDSMVPRRGSPAAAPVFPATDTPWGVGESRG